MSQITRRYNSEESKKRILSACVKLFIEKGYKNTTLSEILRAANVTSSTFQNIFKAKDGVLLDLVEFMFESQFSAAGLLAGKNMKPVYIYAVETALQMTITELNENLREIYVEAYSHPAAAEYIYRNTAHELYRIFSTYMPGCGESDFYEFEIGSSGIMRSYMAKKCDMYFTLERKLSRFLEMSLCVYNVPEAERKEVIAFVHKLDIRSMANDIIKGLFKKLSMKFEFELGDTVLTGV